MFADIAIIVTATAVLAVLALPRVANARLWRATLTPLASIIGSGFLIIGPILDHAFGGMAPLAMAAICATAWAFGAAVRETISDRPSRVPLTAPLDRIASWALAFAYVISVAYYLNLFGAFAVAMTPTDGPANARYVASAALILILVVGWTRGLGALERMEQVAVTLKLAIIAGLLAGMTLHFGGHAAEGSLVINPVTVSGWSALTLLFGLIVTVQGFETSRYLGAQYDADLRRRSMIRAQAISTAIYMTYIGLMAYVFHPDELHLSETAIIDLMAIVAPLLPILLVVAALSAQFSAAVADTAGSGGLVHDLTRGRVSARTGYAGLVTLGLLLTWSADVFQIISYASRAFAVYYALQSVIAALIARERGQGARAAAFAALACLGTAIALFGAPVEG